MKNILQKLILLKNQFHSAFSIFWPHFLISIESPLTNCNYSRINIDLKFSGNVQNLKGYAGEGGDLYRIVLVCCFNGLFLLIESIFLLIETVRTRWEINEDNQSKIRKNN